MKNEIFTAKNTFLKMWVLFIFILGNGLVSKAQSVSYKVVLDEPDKVNNISCNLDLFHADGGIKQLSGFSLNTGLWGHAMYKHVGGIDYSIRHAWLTTGKILNDKTPLRNSMYIQSGIFFIFHKKTKEIRAQVVMSSKTEYHGTYQTTYSKYIYANAHRMKYQALRGGIYFKRSVMKYEIPDPSGYGRKEIYTNYYIFGIYGGICFGRTLKLGILTDNFGERGSAYHYRYIWDILITPIHNVPGNYGTINPIGGRFMVQIIPSITRAERKKYGIGGARFPWEVEVGYRAVDGPYCAVSLSIPLFCRNLKVLGYQPTELVRTSE
ncbi:MAG: hypothetical protein OHK0036_08510 [Bacteroidia bacterium]